MNKTLSFALIIIWFLVAWIVLHEITHMEIDRIYGCTNISMSIEWNAVVTHAECPNNNSDLAQSINEVVGYNVMPFLLIILLVLIFKDI